MTEQELEEWAQLGRSITAEDRVRHAPPPHIWDNIAAAISDEPTSELGENTREARIHEGRLQEESIVVDLSDRALSDVSPTTPIDLTVERSRRGDRGRQRNMLLAGAASVLLFLIGFSVFGADEPVPTFAAEATNATLPEAFDGTASAVVEVNDSPRLEISFDGTLPSEEPVELWLIKPDLSDMRSLGTVDPGADSWSGDWPADLDPNEYSLVDLSIEPDDGDPTHSGRSILRGQLAEV